MVTKFLPVPSDNGGKQRSEALLRRLASLGEVVLVAFDDGTADHEALRAMGVDVHSVPWPPGLGRALRGTVTVGSASAGRFWSDALHTALVRAAGDRPFDVLIVEYGQLAPYRRDIPARLTVWNLHNVESALARSYARTRGRLGRLPFLLEAAGLRRLERGALGDFDATVVVSESDRRRLPHGSGRVLVCPNGCDPTTPVPPASGPVAAFVATLSWPPNTDAAVWLGREIWPAVRRRLPDARLLIVGRNPPAAVTALRGSGVEVAGDVADVWPYLAEARVAVAPLRAGGGSRLKILEALNAGRPVVATSVGAEGLDDLVGDGVVIADTVDAIAECVAALLADPDGTADLGRRGHDAVVARYSWDSTLSPLLDLVAG